MSDKSKTAEREEQILKFWQENKIFQKALDKKSPKGEFVFYDGPPFATGLPHYGHILAGTMKDVIPRYKTMQGYRVPRVWGWDCHGLPIENLIEKELGLETKKDIEKYGIGNFNKAARDGVLRYEKEWKKFMPRIGRWVDMDNAYKTMNASYTESVWWSFKNLFEKKLVYEGFKVMPFCPHCGTTISNFEVNLGYKDITDISVYVKFKVKGQDSTYLLAWTTTPWTLPGNVALAVGADIEYAEVVSENANFILAKNKLEEVFKDKKYEIVKEVKGRDLVGLKYEPVFNYYNNDKLENKENAWEVYAGDFVMAEEGTGIVHMSPAFGADDYELSQREKLPFVQHVDMEGKMKPEVLDFAGLFVKPKKDDEKERLATDISIIRFLQEKGNFFDKKKLNHSYPHCWRCDTPLLNYATSSWFVKVTDLKEKMSTLNQKINWIPETIGEGRFGKWLEGAKDWAVSRSRYWGAPLPVWRNEKGEIKVLGSVEELKKYTKTNKNKFIFIRHGEAESNLNHVVNCDPEKEVHLTENGKEQAKETARKINKIDAMYVSPYIRTKETAKIIAENRQFNWDKVIEDERLVELDFGDLDGKSFDDYLEYEEKNVFSYETPMPSGESYQDAKERFGEFLYEVDKKHSGETIVVVTHGIGLEVVASIIEGGDLKRSKEIIDTYSPKPGETLEFDFVPLPHNENYELDLHRPHIDEISLVDEEGNKLTRVKEVFDTWYDSGSMPYASHHYPFDAKKSFFGKPELAYPAEFIAEGLDQTRGWFYTLLVLGTGLFGKSPYKNVIVNGIVLAEDGQKMSKKLKNYPDPSLVINKYGADALRYYFLSSPAMRAEDLAFSEKSLDELSKKLLARLDNVLSFYLLYKNDSDVASKDSKNILDKWLLSRLNQLGGSITNSLESFELDKASRPILDFIEDFSVWYVRRSRDRFKSEDEADRNAAVSTTRYVLLELAKYMAPFTPFFSEHIYRELKLETDPESVHLCSWPVGYSVDKNLIVEMDLVRKVVSEVLMMRNSLDIKVRQPLGKLEIQDVSLKGKDGLLELIKEEVNVKEIVFNVQIDGGFKLDTLITPELKKEGNAREFVRAVQEMRKEANLKPQEIIDLEVETDNAGQDFLNSVAVEIKRPTNISNFNFKVVEGKTLEIDGLNFKICITNITPKA